MHTNCPNCPIVLTVLLSGLDSEAFSPSASLSQAYPILAATMLSSSAAARQKCRPEITISDGKWGAILELRTAITQYHG